MLKNKLSQMKIIRVKVLRFGISQLPGDDPFYKGRINVYMEFMRGSKFCLNGVINLKHLLVPGKKGAA